MEIKSYIILFVLFMLIESNQFINGVLSKIKGTVDGTNNVTSYGKVAQGLILVLAYACIITLVSYDYL